MSLKKFSVGTLQSKKLSTYKFSSNRLSLRRFPFPSAPAVAANYVEDVFSTYLYTGNGGYDVIENEVPLTSGTLQVGGSVLVPGSWASLGTNAGNAGYSFGTGDFTVEGFINFGFLPVGADGSTGDGIFTLQDGVNGGWGLVASNDGVGTNIRFSFYQDTSLVTQGTVTNFPLNTWRHVAVTRQSNTFRIFVNGILVSSGTSAANLSLTNSIIVGYSARTGASPRACFSNVRAVKGTALYTAAFTPPTSALTAVSGTVLLFCQGATPFVDNSSIAAAISPGAIHRVKTFGPFAGSTVTSNGGLVFIKGRDVARAPIWFDTARGAGYRIYSNGTLAQALEPLAVSAFNTNGFNLGPDSDVNLNGNAFVSWTFRRQAKFFDIVTYTGNGTARTISHNLGSVPGCIIVKRTDSSTSGNWYTYHRSIGNGFQLFLNLTNGSDNSSNWNATTPTSTVFSVGGGSADTNVNGGTYVAYLFAHDAGGFGNLGTDNVISCGTFTADSSGNATVTLGYEPQWVLLKRTNGVETWYIVDNIRGIGWNSGTYPAAAFGLYPNTSGVETSANILGLNPTGFSTSTGITGDGVYSYIAIRRGPMRTPTDASKVFQPVVYTGTNVDNRLVPTGILTDMIMARQRNSTTIGFVVGDRLRGNQYLRTDNDNAGLTDADSLMTPTVGYGNSFSAMNGFGVGNDATSQLNISTVASNQVVEAFARAPGFLDIVTYTGTGVARTINHNLGVIPKMMWIKGTNSATDSWIVYSSALGSDVYVGLQSSVEPTTSTTAFNSTAPTASVFSVGSNGETNGNGDSFVAYLFGEIPGISKVSYYLGKGVGTVNQVDCGFTTGARFLLVKSLLRTASWYVWDTARGIVAGNDPYILADLDSAEATGDDYVDSYAAGFELSTTAPEQLNGSYADNWDPQLAVAGTSNVLDIMYENGYWVAAASGSSIYYSVSGYNWTQVTGALAAGTITGLAFGNGLYITVGTSGRISTSSNLTSWTAQTSGTAQSLTGAAYAFGKYWVCGNAGTVVSSADGVTWSTVSIGTANGLNRVRFLNGNLVFVGNSGTIVTTADGTTFTVRTSGVTEALNEVTYGNGLYVIVGSAGRILTSSDLVTWTSRSAGALSGNGILGVTWTGNRFVAVATAGETGYSSDGITWSTGSGAGGDPIYCVAYGNDMTIAGNGSGNFYASNPKFIFIAIA